MPLSVWARVLREATGNARPGYTGPDRGANTRPDRFKEQLPNCLVLARPNELMTFARNSEHALRSR